MTTWGEMTHLPGVRAECAPDAAGDGSRGLFERMRHMLGFSHGPACGHDDCAACSR